MRFFLFFAFCLTLLFFGSARATEAPSGAIVVGDRVIFMLRADVGGISPAERAGIINARLVRVLAEKKLHPEELEIATSADGEPILQLPGLSLIGVTQADARAENTTPEELASRWERLLRTALVEAKPLYRAESGHEGFSFVPLLLVSGSAFLVPVLAARFKKFPIPVVVGEILLGIIIGRSGFDLVRFDSWLQFLAEFGFAYLMFLSGMEVDVDLLRPNKDKERSPSGEKPKNLPALAGVVFALTMGLALLVSIGLTRYGLIESPWMMTLILSTVSLGLVVPMLKERGLSSGTFGQAILVTALVADFVTMFLISVLAGWMSSGPTLKLFLGLGLLLAFGGAVRVGSLLKSSSKLGSLMEGVSNATAQIAVRGSLFLMLAFVALSAQLGTEMILGAFLAGVLLSIFVKDEQTDLNHNLEAMGFGFFIPIFFVMVGARFDITALTGSSQGLILAPLLIAAVFVIKVVAALPFRFLVSWRETLAAGLLMAPGLSLIIAAAEIGQRLGLFSQSIYAALIAVAMVTAVLGPVGFQLMLPQEKSSEPTA